MSKGWRGRAGRLLLLMGGMLAAAMGSPAQDDSGAAAAAFAGGQMVRGTVSSVGTDRLEVKTETGETYRVVVTTNTRMMRERQPVKLADIKPGDGVGAMGVMDAPNKTVHAVVLFTIDAEQVRKAAADLGKTYITGRVAAIDELKLTIKRPDGVSQVIRVDEDTSFRRGRRGMNAGLGGTGEGQAGGGQAGAQGGRGGGGSGAESITLADVKVGDLVYGKGGLKSGVFVPTELGVMDGAAAGRGRRRGMGDGAGAGAAGASPGAGAASGGGVPQ